MWLCFNAFGGKIFQPNFSMSKCKCDVVDSAMARRHSFSTVICTDIVVIDFELMAQYYYLNRELNCLEEDSFTSQTSGKYSVIIIIKNKRIIFNRIYYFLFKSVNDSLLSRINSCQFKMKYKICRPTKSDGKSAILIMILNQ